MRIRPAALAVATVLLAACATHPPHPLQGEYTPITPREAAEADYSGRIVRWGGRLVQVEPRQDATCFEMVSNDLDAHGRPLARDDGTGGRFVACRSGFYDPAVFKVNREVTFIGALSGHESRRIAGHDYRFPRLDAEVVHLWPEPMRTSARPAPWPWWGSW